MASEKLNKDLEDIDFENFQVSSEFRAGVKTLIDDIKSRGLIDGLRLLCEELGVEDSSEAAKDLFDQGTKTLIFKSGANPNISVSLNADELVLKDQEILVLHVSFLPKDKEFLLFGISPQGVSHLELCVTQLELELNAAKKRKSDRNAAFKAKIQGNA